MRIVAILLGLILIAGIIVPFIPSDVYATHNGSHIIDMASGAELENGSIVYVDTSAGSSPSVNFWITKSSGAEVTLITELPGAEFLIVNSSLLLFSWSVSDLPDDVAPPVAYSVTFNTTRPNDMFEEKNILIAIETEVPVVEITFDRFGYVAGDIAIIKVNDPRANLHDFFDVLPVREDGEVGDGVIDNLDSIQVEIRIQGQSGVLVQTRTAMESEEEGGIFVIEYPIPAGNYNHIRATYKDQQARADIGRSIWIDDTHYEIPDQIQVIVRDSGRVGDGSGGVNVEVSSESVAMGLTLEEVGDSGRFEGIIELSDTTGPVAGVERVAANVNDNITLSYQNQVVQAKVIEPVFRFDREWYANSEYATITVVDKDMNVDKFARDTLPIQVTSDRDSTPITNELIETGPDTATFRSYEMVLVTNDTEAATNPHSVYAVDGDTITFTYSGGSNITSVGIPADVDTFPLESGAGESGISPNPAQAIFSGITNLSCGSYGDTDGDGLCDNWEPGGTYLKITYGGTLHTFTESCGPCPSKTKDDIYWEVDYDSTIAGYPSYLTTALTNIKNVFATSPGGGIVLHYYVDDGLSSLPEDVKIWSDAAGDPPGTDSYTEIKQNNFGLVASWSANKDKAWHNAVHYALVIKDQAHDQGSSGIAEMVGDDAVVSLFGFANSVDQIQGTLMHELGHNLGLKHGGGLETFPPTPGPPETYDWFDDSSTNCKPNYPSVMNYDRQFGDDMITGITFTYSPGTLKVNNLPDAPLDLDDLNENHGVQPPSGSTVKFVYGVTNPSYDPIPPPDSVYNIDQPIGPGNPVNFPRMALVKEVTNTNYAVDWNNNGFSTDPDVTNTVYDISILRCDLANNPIPTGNVIRDHNDWNRLIMNFRYYNPDSLLTGSRIVSPGISEIGWELEKVHGIANIDRAIQDLNTTAFFEGADETAGDGSRVILFEDIGSHSNGNLIQFTTGETGQISGRNSVFVEPDSTTILTVFIQDSDLNTNPGVAEEYGPDDNLVTFSTNRTEVGGGEPIIEETDINSGIFVFELDLLTDEQACDDDDLSDEEFQAQGDDDPSIGVCPGDLLSITYDDEDPASVVVTKVIEILSIEDFKEEVHNILMVQDGSKPSVAANIQRFGNATTVQNAVEQLESLRILMDSSKGGNLDDDVLGQDGQAQITPMIDNALAVLKNVELNEPYLDGKKAFTLTSQQGGKEYEIVGESETITPVVDSFTFDPAAKLITIDLIGQGDVELTIPNDITDKITSATVRDENVEVQEISSNETHATFLVKALKPHPRQLFLSYGPAGLEPLKFPVTLTPPDPRDTRGNPLIDLVKDSQMVLTTTAKNSQTTRQPVTVMVEVKNSDGVVVFLAWLTGEVNARGEIDVGLSWIPGEAGEYEISVFAWSSLAHPQALSEIATTSVTVVEDGGGIVRPLPGSTGGAGGGICRDVVCP